MEKVHLTKEVVEAVKPGNRDIIVWDADLTGFGLKVTPRERRSYFFYYRTRGGRERRPVIGRHGDLTCDKARKIAKAWSDEVAAGGDPSGDRQAERQADTFAAFAKRYMEDIAPETKRPSSIVTDKLNLKNHLLPALGTMKVADITTGDVKKLRRRMEKTPTGFNRTLALLSHMMNTAEDDEFKLRAPLSNPCRRVKKYTEKVRTRYLSPDELARLGDALADAEHTRTVAPAAIAAIRLLMFTGARRAEILTLRWEHVDRDARRLRLPDSKTGAKEIYLPSPALEVLDNIERREDSPWVINGKVPSVHLEGLRKPWARICRAAGLDDLRVHDLRHSFASVGVASDLTLLIIGKLLGHKQARTSERYAHLADDPAQAAAEKVGKAIDAAMKRNIR
jgi:integrase